MLVTATGGDDAWDSPEQAALMERLQGLSERMTEQGGLGWGMARHT